MKQEKKVEKYTSHHWWTSVIWRMQNWRQSTKNTKVELYSEATLWKTILDLMQYSLDKDHQHHKWQPEKSWISYPDCQGAQDKQLTQYPVIPRSKWEMYLRYWKFQNRNVQIFGYVYQNTNGPNHGPVWKTFSCSSWAESVRSPFCRAVMGKAMWESSIEIWLGKSSILGMFLL